MRIRNRVIGVAAAAVALSLSSTVVAATTASAEGTSGTCTISVKDPWLGGATHGVKFDWVAFPRTFYPNPVTWNVYGKRDVFNANTASQYSFSSFQAKIGNLITALPYDNTNRFLGVYSTVPSYVDFSAYRVNDAGTDGRVWCRAY